jgi:hypothetical protein
MGRPINKKFFGNLNNPYNRVPQNDTGTGGESLANITISAPGSYTSALPTVVNTSPTPDLNVESNVAALIGAVHGKALSAVATVNGTGYAYGNTLNENVAAGNNGIYATWTVTALKVAATTLNAGGNNIDAGDEYTFSGSYAGGSWTTPLVVHVDTVSSGHVLTYHVVTAGVWTGSSAPTTTAGATVTQTAAGMDYNGTGLVLNLTSYGVAGVTLATEGDYTAITGGAKATTVTSGSGAGATLTITYGVKSVAITSGGSGYLNAPALAFSPSGATGAIHLTSTTNTSLNVTAWVPFTTSNTPNTSGSGIAGDIVKQEASHRYYVDTNQGHGACKLVAGAVTAIGQMNLIATDYNGNTYYVTKLTSRKAQLTRKTQSGSNAWVYGVLDANTGTYIDYARWSIGSAVGTDKTAATTKVSLASD